MAAKRDSDDLRLATSCAAESQLNEGRSVYIFTLSFILKCKRVSLHVFATVDAQRCMFMHNVIKTTYNDLDDICYNYPRT